MGKATRAPSSFRPSVWWSSNPTQTPAVKEGENPMNQASVKSLVVPVLPATGRLSALARTPVPELMTSRSMEVSRRAIGAGSTSLTWGGKSSMTRPS